METGKNSLKRFKKIAHKNADTIKLVASNFYSPDSYHFRALLTDLTTHLWLTVRNLDPGTRIYNEQAWVYAILYRKALNIVRDEQRHQKHLIYNADLSNLPDKQEQEHDPDTEQLYSLINCLDDKDKELITMYLDGIPIKAIAALNGKTLLQTQQHLLYLRKKLRKLNKPHPPHGNNAS